MDQVQDPTTRLSERFKQANDLTEIEMLADAIGSQGLTTLAPDLVRKLESSSVRDDDDAFDAVCGALTRLGVMTQLGNMNYRFLPASDLPTGMASILEERRPNLPSTLFA